MRTVYGSRISLVVGVYVSAISIAVGFCIGLLSGYHRRLDTVVMRVMDGLMAIPGIFLAIALMALMSASVRNVVIALAVPEIPRVVRLLRALVLSLRQQPFVGARSPRRRASPRILFRHIMPNTLAAVIVQGTYNCASVVIVEAYPSFLGAAPRTSRAGGTSWPKGARTSNWRSGSSSSQACSWPPPSSPSTWSGTACATPSTPSSPAACDTPAWAWPSSCFTSSGHQLPQKELSIDANLSINVCHTIVTDG